MRLGMKSGATKIRQPNIDLAGPLVGDDVRRLIDRYGAKAVKDAVKEQTKAKPGMRPLHSDWQRLEDTLKQDAKRWLEGGDPFEERKNYSIAKRFAEQYPQAMTTFESVRDRIMRKLRVRRRYYTLVHAEMMSRESYPYGNYLRVLAELVKTGRLTEAWGKRLRQAEAVVADYSAKYGQPGADMTMHAIELEAAKPLPIESDLESRNVLQLLRSAR